MAVEQEIATETAVIDSAQVVHVALQPGWNLISNPFLRLLDWSRVQAYNGISQPIWGFRQGYYRAAHLEPYKGYYFFNLENISSLALPYLLPNADLGKAATSEAAEAVQIHLLAENHAVLDSVQIGRHTQARAGLDELDVIKPRRWLERAGVQLVKSHLPPMLADWRPESAGETAIWRLRFKAGMAGIYHLQRLATADDLPIRLYDPAAMRWHDARQRITIEADAGEVRDFLVYWGMPEDVLGLMSAGGDQAILGAGFPNPFALNISLPAFFPGNTHGDVTIYNLRGQLIFAFPEIAGGSGLHYLQWDGRDTHGRAVANGVYIAVLKSAGRTQAQKLMLLR